MTGVSTDQPNSLQEYIAITNRKIVALERALSKVGLVDLSQYLEAGTGIEFDGFGSREEPYTISVASTGVDNWDEATAPGFYWAEAGSDNAPTTTNFFIGYVEYAGGTLDGRVQQFLHIPGTTSLAFGTYKRTFDGTNWSAWRQTVPLTGVVTIAGSGSNNYGQTAVSFPAGYFMNAPRVLVGTVVNTTGSSITGAAVSITAAGFTARAASNSGAAFGSSYDLTWFAQEPAV